MIHTRLADWVFRICNSFFQAIEQAKTILQARSRDVPNTIPVVGNNKFASDCFTNDESKQQGCGYKSIE